jgi:hypothetical protein
MLKHFYFLVESWISQNTSTDQVDSLTDNELDNNGLIENHDCLPKDGPVEDEIPLNQLLNTGKSIGKPWCRSHCKSYLQQP